MPRCILLSALDENAVKHIAWDKEASQLLPLGEAVIDIAICDDTRRVPVETDHETRGFELLGKYLNDACNWRGTIRCTHVSLFDESAYEVLSSCHIFYMCGGSPGQAMPERLRKAFRDLNASKDLDLLHFDPQWPPELRAMALLKERVAYNECVYMGSCMGAVCAGRYYWQDIGKTSGVDGRYPTVTQRVGSALEKANSSRGAVGLGLEEGETYFGIAGALAGELEARGVPLFDVLDGTTFVYNAGVAACELADLAEISYASLVIRSGTALVVAFGQGMQMLKLIRISRKDNGWEEYCAKATQAMATVVPEIAHRYVGPFKLADGREFFYRMDGAIA